MDPNTLKAVSKTQDELRVGNYMVLFGGQDLAGEFFTKSTNFGSNYTDLGLLYVDFEHGIDVDKTGNDANNVLGIVDWKTARVDERGIYVERILNRRAKYIQFVENLIDAGVIGTSSAAIPGQTARRKSGEITDWPLMRDSLTVTPMEPRMASENVLIAAKSLVEFFPNAKSLRQLCGIQIPEDTVRTKAIADIGSLADAEKFLRDLGSSKSEATALVSKIKKFCRSDSGGNGDQSDSVLSEVLAALKTRDVLRK